MPDTLCTLLRSLEGMEHAFLKVESIEEKEAGEFILEARMRAEPDGHARVYFELRFESELSLLCAAFTSQPYITDDPTAESAKEALEEYDSDAFIYFLTEEHPRVMIAVYAWEVEKDGRISCDGDPRTEILKMLSWLPAAWEDAFDFMCRETSCSVTGIRTFLH